VLDAAELDGVLALEVGDVIAAEPAWPLHLAE
jgi:hypothetical protein